MVGPSLGLAGIGAAMLLAALAFLMGWAAVEDIRRYRIPNIAVLAIVALWPLFVSFAPSAPDWAPSLLGGVIVLAVGFVAWNGGLIGGGDAKLAAAIALWAGPFLLPWYLLLALVLGGALAITKAVVVLTARTAIGPAGPGNMRERLDRLRGQPLPYGIALALAGGWVAWQHLLAI